MALSVIVLYCRVEYEYLNLVCRYILLDERLALQESKEARLAHVTIPFDQHFH